MLYRVWEQLQNSDMPPPESDMAKWEAEFNQLMRARRDEFDLDYEASMQKAWEDYNGDFTNQESSVKFDNEGLPILSSYTFGP